MSEVDDILALANNSNKVKPQPSDLGEELGIASSLPIGSWSQWLSATSRADNGLLLNRVDAVPLKSLHEMRRMNGQARALIRMMSIPPLAALRTAEWIAGEGLKGTMDDEVQFANDLFRMPMEQGGMSTPLSKVLRQTLLGLVDGFACFEEVRQIAPTGPQKGKVVLRKLAYRDARTVTFRADPADGGFDGIRQQAFMGGRTVDVIIPADKMWYWAANEAENPFYGISYFETAFHHYEIIKKLHYIAHIAAQIAAVPMRVGYTGINPDPKRMLAFKKALANLAFNTAMVAPEGWKVETIANHSGFDFIRLIEHHQNMMSRSVMAGFLDTAGHGRAVINNAHGDPMQDMFVMALETVMDDISESWSTHLLPSYMDWNFGTGKYPKFRFGKLADTTKDVIKELFTQLMVAPTINATPEFFREVETKMSDEIGLNIDYDKIALEEKKQADAQAKLQQAQQFLGQQDPNNPAPPGGGDTASLSADDEQLAAMLTQLPLDVLAAEAGKLGG